jgi:hypothetical protein
MWARTPYPKMKPATKTKQIVMLRFCWRSIYNSGGHEIEIHTLKPPHAGRHDRSHAQKTPSNDKSENGCH